MSERVKNSITGAEHYAQIFEEEEVGKLLDHIHAFGDTLDSITDTIHNLTNELQQATGNTADDSKTISAVIGLISLVATEANELTSLLSSILSLDVGAGGSGGVAAGIEGAIIGKVNLISIGPATFGTLGFIFSTISNILNYIDSFIGD
jgi:hypothetical protein